MNICITRSNKFTYSETFLRNQIKGLSQLADVYTLYGGWLPEYAENGKLLNNKIYWLLNKIWKNVFKKNNNYFGNHGIERFLIRNQIEVVLANYGIGAVKLLPICKKLGLPLIAHFHGFDASDKKIVSQYQRQYQELFDYATAIVAVSKDMRQALIALGAPDNKIFVNVYGVNVDLFRVGCPSQHARRFIAVARFAPKKAPQKTILAFSKVVTQFPDAQLTMVGPQDGLFQSCCELVQRLELSDNISFAGPKSPEEVSELLHQSMAFVQHSIVAPSGDSEGSPNSIIEASSCGLPIISTRHAGIKDIVVEGKTGFLVEEGDVDGMAESMMKLAANPKLADEMGAAGRKYVEENYRLQDRINRLYQIIQESV